MLIPLFAVIGAAIWGSWASRNKTIGDVAELAGYARFRDAMERTHVTSDPAAAPASASARPERDFVTPAAVAPAAATAPSTPAA
ncbi:hypothetical protein [Streptomyces sp. NPDC090025]|uniref:hypothetical protein n=1 Tax=Streptomyces sp. NPDC090025 TaxID=3365922 RepID=UPI003837765F